MCGSESDSRMWPLRSKDCRFWRSEEAAEVAGVAGAARAGVPRLVAAIQG